MGEADELSAPWIGAVTTKGSKPAGLDGDFEANITVSGPAPTEPFGHRLLRRSVIDRATASSGT